MDTYIHNNYEYFQDNDDNTGSSFLKKTSYYFLPFFTQIHRFYFHFSFQNEFNVSKNPDIRLKSMEINLFGTIW